MQSKLNTRNKLVTLGDIKKILLKAGIEEEPKRLDTYIQAFTHKSYTQQKEKNIMNFNEKCVQLQRYSLENYEFVGDSFIENVVCLYLFRRYTFLKEGNLTRLKQRIVDSKTLASFGRLLGFQEWCLVSNFMENTSGRNSDKLMEDTFEAFVFALYLDLGNDVVHKFVINIIEQVVDFTEINMVDINYKHQLLEIFQKFWNLTPGYLKISEIGPPHQKTYIVGTTDFLGNIIAKGTATMKRDAEQLASLNSINLMNKIIKLVQTPEEITTEITDFSVREMTGIIMNMKDILEPDIYTCIVEATKDVNIFLVEFIVNGEKRRYTVRYTPESYTQYKNVLNDKSKRIDFECNRLIQKRSIHLNHK